MSSVMALKPENLKEQKEVVTDVSFERKNIAQV